MENKRLYPDFQLEDYVSNYSESEIDLLTQFKLVVKGEEGFVVMFSSIPDEKLEAVIECCKGKTNVAIKIMKEDRERFMNCNYSFHDVIVEYSCDTVSQATEEVINRFGEARILIGGRNNFNSRQIPIQKYRFILQKLRKIIKDITMDQPEEERFKQVYIKLAQNLTYDKDMISMRKKYKTYQEINEDSSRNLENALLTGKCVCAGMAETLKQALSLVGIECINCESKIDRKGNSHVFNLVKINNTWYNTDLTYDCEKIVDRSYPLFCLRSDEEFEKGFSKVARIYHQKSEKGLPECPCSLELFEERKKKGPIEQTIKKMIGRIKKIFQPKDTVEELSAGLYEENNSEREEKNRFREKYHVEDSSKQKNIANTLKENSGENIKGEKTDKTIEQQFDI